MRKTRAMVKRPDLLNSHDDFSQKQGELPSLEDYFVE